MQFETAVAKAVETANIVEIRFLPCNDSHLVASPRFSFSIQRLQAIVLY